MTTRDLIAANDAPEIDPAEPKAGEPSWPQVRAFLQAHPEHLAHDRELHETLHLKPTGPNVVDFGRAALARLEAVAARESGARKAIEQVARANFAAQAQTHAAVIDVLESRNHTDLARRLDDAARHRFGLVTGVIALERPGGVPHGWRPLEESVVDMLLGPDGLSRLGQDTGNEGMFAERAAEVRSSALVRLSLWSQARPALVAFGSPDPEGFSHDMGAELVAFVARVVERTAERWPVL
ncbi:MAG TPA: DUF484 family protein [Caulobacteraceae bacterium]|nr:DUF484 family protein [Caulobacteraceae bacterium]